MKKKILVIDDDPGLQDMFKIVLSYSGYDVDIESNGQNIINDLFKLPDLFLLDKQLSGIDGINVCRHLKANDKFKDIPVIMISANPDILILAKEAGADASLEKPFEVKQLLTLITKHLDIAV